MEIDIYRKPTTTDLTIHATSNHPIEHKLAAYRYYSNKCTIWFLFRINLTYMFRPIRPSSGHQSLRTPRIQFCQRKQKTLKVLWCVPYVKWVHVILNWIVKSWIVESISSCSLWCGLCWSALRTVKHIFKSLFDVEFYIFGWTGCTLWDFYSFSRDVLVGNWLPLCLSHRVSVLTCV
jgi:hypothetical protein